MPRTINLSANIRPILGAIRAVPIPARPGAPPPPAPVAPFVTISREAGAGGWTLAQALVDALNLADPREQAWTCWDRELVEKVAADHHLAQRLIDALGTTQHSWFGDFLGSLSFTDHPDAADEMRVFRTIASTIRALAQTGRVIIVGRGGVFLTRHMPGGVHVRLVAPLQRRIDNLAAYLNVPREEAVAKVRELTKAREAFYHRYWPKESLRPDLFTATLNTAAISPPAVIRIITELVRHAAHPAAENRIAALPAAAT